MRDTRRSEDAAMLRIHAMFFSPPSAADAVRLQNQYSITFRLLMICATSFFFFHVATGIEYAFHCFAMPPRRARMYGSALCRRYAAARSSASAWQQQAADDITRAARALRARCCFMRGAGSMRVVYAMRVMPRVRHARQEGCCLLIRH